MSLIALLPFLIFRSLGVSEKSAGSLRPPPALSVLFPFYFFLFPFYFLLFTSS
jgi:hypothetical protein